MRRRKQADDNPFSLFSFQDIITSVTGIIILLALLLVVELSKRPKQVSAGAPDSTQQVQAELREIEARISAVSDLIKSSTAFANDIASLPGAQVHQHKQDIRKDIAALEAALVQLGDDEHRTNSAAEVEGAGAASKEALLASLQKKNAELKALLESARRSNRVVYSADPNASKSAWIVDLRDDGIEVGRPKQDGIHKAFSSSDSTSSFLEWATQRNQHTEYFVLLVRPETIRAYEQVSSSLRDAGFTLGFDLIGAEASVLDDAATEEASQ